jgi:PIN like domain
MSEKSDNARTPAPGAEPRPAAKPAEKKRDIFIRDATYPDPESAFRVRTAQVGTVKETCMFVLDTNTLLAPFGVDNKTLGEIARVFKLLVEQGRLCVPAQVAREFADNRAKRLMEIYAEVQQKRQRPVLNRSPLLESMSSYAAVALAERAVEEAWKTYSAALGDVMRQMEAWNWNDPVSEMYAEIFVGKNVVTSIKYDAPEMRADLARRYEHGIPPGYKDKGKDDEGIGELRVAEAGG